MNAIVGRRFFSSLESIPALPIVRVAVVVALMLVAAVAGEWLRPTYRLSEHRPSINLVSQIPESFGDWRIDRSITPVEPDPGLQAMLDTLYSQTLARTYINKAGERVMLSIAYGSDQSNEATAVHRPEFCYSAQGFRVEALGAEQEHIGSTQIPVARLVARLGARIEPITYWVTLDESAALPGLRRKLEQVRYGLRGEIPDGMLVRVSSISASSVDAFVLQQKFLTQLYATVPADVRARYFGGRLVSADATVAPSTSVRVTHSADPQWANPGVKHSDSQFTSAVAAESARSIKKLAELGTLARS